MKERSIFMHLSRRSKLARWWFAKIYPFLLVPALMGTCTWSPNEPTRHLWSYLHGGMLVQPLRCMSVDFCTTGASNCLIRLISTFGPSVVQRLEIYQINNWSNVRIYSLCSLIYGVKFFAKNSRLYGVWWDCGIFFTKFRSNLIGRDKIPRFPYFCSVLTSTTYLYKRLKVSKFALLAH
jgi:hypothetical protein